MAIDIPYLKTVAINFLEVLEREGIKSVEDVQKNLGKTFEVKKELFDYIEVGVREFRRNLPQSYRISYFIPGRGIAIIEVRVNPTLNYIQIITKAKKIISGYNSFGGDEFGNILQFKIERPLEWSRIEKGLEKLVTLEV